MRHGIPPDFIEHIIDSSTFICVKSLMLSYTCQGLYLRSDPLASVPLSTQGTYKECLLWAYQCER